MKKTLTTLSTGLVLIGMTGTAHASLATIGTASYEGSSYNLIWDNDNNGKSLVWLDYSNPVATWDNQMAWAAGMNTTGVLTYAINPGYTVTFAD